jgi:hypothetical protein
MSLLFLIGVLLAAYISYVRLLRWHRYAAVHAKYAGRPLDSITTQEAQEIMQLSMMWDLPWITLYSLSFAMFKGYGIVATFPFGPVAVLIEAYLMLQPSISVILANTKELNSKDLVSKRQADVRVVTF